jgi:hypothetical protein
MGLGFRIRDEMRHIHGNDIGSRTQQGTSTWDGLGFYFFFSLEVIPVTRSLDDAAFDFLTLVVKLSFLLPHAEV